MANKKQHNLFHTFVMLMLLASGSAAHASDIRLGFSLGWGGAGITKVQPAENDDGDTVPTTFNKAQRPGVFGIQADLLVHRDITASLEHSRGFTLGPFSSSVAFTGLAGRYYFFGGAPVDTRASDYAAIIRVRRYAMFAGGAMGVAKGKIIDSRAGEISSSGFYVGYKVGMEYLLNPRFGIRPEINYLTTLFSAQTNPAQLKEFSIQCGLFFFL